MVIFLTPLSSNFELEGNPLTTDDDYDNYTNYESTSASEHNEILTITTTATTTTATATITTTVTLTKRKKYGKTMGNPSANAH